MREMSVILLGDPTSIKDEIQRALALALAGSATRLSVREYEELHRGAEESVRSMNSGLPAEHEMSDEQLARFTPRIDQLIVQRLRTQYRVQPSSVTSVFVVAGSDFGILEVPGTFPRATLYRLP